MISKEISYRNLNCAKFKIKKGDNKIQINKIILVRNI